MDISPAEMPVLPMLDNLTLAGAPLQRGTFGCLCVRTPVAVHVVRAVQIGLSAVAAHAIEAAFPSAARNGFPDRQEWVHVDLPYEGPDPDARVLLTSVRRELVVPHNWVQLTFTEWFNDVAYQSLVFKEGVIEPWQEMCSRLPPFVSVEGRYLVVVEPAGTHGRCITALITRYLETGTPLGVIVLAAVVTPDFCQLLAERHPEARIFALRLDPSVDGCGFPVPGFIEAQYKPDVDADLLREPS